MALVEWIIFESLAVMVGSDVLDVMIEEKANVGGQV